MTLPLVPSRVFSLRVLSKLLQSHPKHPKVFGCTCFVRDVHPQVSKLDSVSLKCIFVGYSCVKKGYRCYCPTLQCYFMSTNVAFFDTTPFSLPSTATSQGRKKIFLFILLPHPLSLSNMLVLALVKPPITQVYTRRQHPVVSSPPPVALTSDPVHGDDLPVCSSNFLLLLL